MMHPLLLLIAAQPRTRRRWLIVLMLACIVALCIVGRIELNSEGVP